MKETLEQSSKPYQYSISTLSQSQVQVLARRQQSDQFEGFDREREQTDWMRRNRNYLARNTRKGLGSVRELNASTAMRANATTATGVQRELQT